MTANRPRDIEEWKDGAFEHFLSAIQAGQAQAEASRRATREHLAHELADVFDTFDQTLASCRLLGFDTPRNPQPRTDDERAKTSLFMNLLTGACDVGEEALSLGRSGFVSALASRCRRLHEEAVISRSLARAEASTARLCLGWGIWQDWRAYEQYCNVVIENGGVPYRLDDEEEFRRTARVYRDEVIAKVGAVQQTSDYAWAGHPGAGSRMTFADLEREAGMSLSRTWYLFGSSATHGGVRPDRSGRSASDLTPGFDDLPEVVADYLGFAGRSLLSVAEDVSGLGWYGDDDTLLHPFLLATGGAVTRLEAAVGKVLDSDRSASGGNGADT